MSGFSHAELGLDVAEIGPLAAAEAVVRRSTSTSAARFFVEQLYGP